MAEVSVYRHEVRNDTVHEDEARLVIINDIEYASQNCGSVLEELAKFGWHKSKAESLRKAAAELNEKASRLWGKAAMLKRRADDCK